VQPSDSDEESKKDKKDKKVKAKAETKAVVLSSDEKAAKRKQLKTGKALKKSNQSRKASVESATSSSCEDLTQTVAADVEITVAPPHKI
jgi:hypothetical protein